MNSLNRLTNICSNDTHSKEITLNVKNLVICLDRMVASQTRMRNNPLSASVALKETSQLICAANQLIGFYMRATLALNGLNNE